eukprot:scaffold42201_cov281-Isochrysis_galbana.AAC.1
MTRPQLRYDCAPERLPVAPPGTAQRTAGSRPDHCPELRLMAREVSAAKTPSGVAAPPFTITASAVHYNTLRGFPISNWISESFMLDTANAYGADHHFHLCTTDGACERHPFLITAIEIAREEPASNKTDTTFQTDRRAFALKRHASLSSPANKYIMAHQSLGPSYHSRNTTQEQSTGPPTIAGTNPTTHPR